MHRALAVAFLIVAMGCSSKGDTPLGDPDARGNTDTGGSGGQVASTDGAVGTGGQTASTGGATGSGGASTGGVTGSGGKNGATGGAIGTGGRSTGTGGATGSGGKNGATGGATGSGGKPGATGGATGTGGKPGATGGATGSGGKPGATGGATGTGGQPLATGGTTGTDGGAHTNPLSQALIDEFVTAHNDARSGAIVALNPPPSPALPPVSWDPILADSAYNYLVKCQSSDGSLVDHNANRSSDYVALGGTGYVGENIYAMQGGAAKPTAAVTLWMGEASSYDYATNSGNAGHYTQVVWRTSVRIGCAIVNCPSVKYSNSILCDYAPGGNMSGQKPY